MAWFKVDDNFILSRKVLRIPREDRALCIGFWTMAGVWSAHERTDGVVPDYVLHDLDCPDAVIDHLVRAGLWLHVDDPKAIVFHDWDDYQPTREQLEAKQAEVSAKRRAAGSKGAAKRWQNDSKTMANDSPEPEPEPEPVGGGTKRAHRLPDDFAITDAMAEWAKVKVPGMDIATATETFIDYWQASGSATARKLDWVKAWQVWMRRDYKPVVERVSKYVTPSLPQPPRLEDLYCLIHPGYPAGQCDRCD